MLSIRLVWREMKAITGLLYDRTRGGKRPSGRSKCTRMIQVATSRPLSTIQQGDDAVVIATPPST